MVVHAGVGLDQVQAAGSIFRMVGDVIDAVKSQVTGSGLDDRAVVVEGPTVGKILSTGPARLIVP